MSWNFFNPFRRTLYSSEIIGGNSSDWLSLADLSYIYTNVSAIRIVADIKANAKANMRLTPVDLKGEQITKESATPDQKKIISLMEMPNPTQSTWEFLRLNSLYKEIWGRTFIHANVPSGYKLNGTTIKSLVSLPTQYTFPIYTGKIISSTKRSDIISKYELRFNTDVQSFDTDNILDRSDANINYLDDIYLSPNHVYDVNSCSKLLSLNKEITIYVNALNGRNSNIKNGGARGIFVSGKKDALGIFNLTDKEKNSAQSELDKYGSMDNQKKYIVTTTPLQYQNIAFSPKDLMLLEETFQSMITISDVFQVPSDLVRLQIGGSGKEAEKELLKRLYTQTIIPESKDTADDLNKFLKTEDFGMKFVASFDHLDFLQEDKKDESIKNRNINIAYRDMFKSGAIVFNTWLRAMGLPEDKVYGEMRIFDLTPEQQSVILGTVQQDVPKK